MKIKKLASLFTVIVMVFAFCACGSGGSGTEGDDTEQAKATERATDPTVGTDIDGRPIDDQSFYGKWIADSSKATNMFDGFEITFNENGTYDAVVTGEEVSGTWTREGERVTIVDEYEILPCDYTYTAKGGLKMYYEGEYVGFHR